MDFTAICDPRWRLVAKEYLLARMLPGHELVAVLPHAYRIPLALRSCKRRLAELTGWLNWLTASSAGSLSQVSQQHCDRYLHHRRARRDRSGAVLGSVDESVARLAAAVVIELALYGELFTADAYAPGFRPWDGRSSARVAGKGSPSAGPRRSGSSSSRSTRRSRWPSSYPAAPGPMPPCSAASPSRSAIRCSARG